MSIYGEQIKMQFEEAVEKGYNSFSVDVEGILDSEDFKLIDALGLGYTVENITNEAVPLGKADGSPNRLRVFGVTRESYDRFIFSVQQPRKPEHVKIMNVLRDNFERYYPKATSLTDANVYYFMVNPSGEAVLVRAANAMIPGAIHVKAKNPLEPIAKRSTEEFILLMGYLEGLPKIDFPEWEAIFRMIGWL
jgi:hypothetical protein